MDLGILNTIIALVIVLLVLSLLVQAIQTLIKKLLKMKSRQIEGSLKDLYEQVVGVNPGPAAPNTASSGPSLLAKIWARIKVVFGKSSPGITDTPADLFKDKVLEQFKAIGRKTLFGNAVLDSLSKQDLFKVMGKLESEDFFPDYVAKFQALCDQIEELRVAIVDTITGDPALQGTANTKIAEARSILAPIFNDVSTIVDGKQVKPKVLFADLLQLSKLDIRGLLDLLDQAQQSITKQKETAAAAGNTGEVAALQELSDEVAKVTKLLGDLSQKFVDAVSPLRNKIAQVELWFDTVTQSFDERYARHMKTVAILISIAVVIMLNANFFQIYKSISTNEVQRNLIIDKGPDLLEQSRKARAEASPSASPVDFKQDLVETRKDIETLSGTYQGFGFEPVTGAQVKSFLWGLGGWTIVTHDDGGHRSAWGQVRMANDDGTSVWRAQTRGEWWERRKGNGATLVGWALMVMLLSVGAPFWQDALESLFGIKNLLRQKSGTQNIEQKSGEGQPKE